jgi:hypothetical protein
VIVRPDLFPREKTVLVVTAVLEIEGVLQTEGGVSVRETACRPCGAAPARHAVAGFQMMPRPLT